MWMKEHAGRGRRSTRRACRERLNRPSTSEVACGVAAPSLRARQARLGADWLAYAVTRHTTVEQSRQVENSRLIVSATTQVSYRAAKQAVQCEDSRRTNRARRR